MRHNKKISGGYVHSLFFGIEDSLISTTGVLAGVAIGAGSKSLILLTALVIISVSSTSMAASEFISEETEEAVIKEKLPANPLISALLIFVAYIVVGVILLLPYLIWPYMRAIPVSIGLALLGLIALGILKGKLTHKSRLRGAAEVLIVGGIATGIGLIIGVTFKV
ncbi:hypothetical protein EXS66_00615 [Candidatus Saccharibacteria bacterium]|nr:hypothetical protein [Candidatus Saccharibacteria bacterium]